MKFIEFGIILTIWALTACTHTASENTALYRPFRMGVMSFSPELNNVKPLAEADYTGWVETGNVLVGSTDNEWVTGWSIETNEALWWVNSKSSLAAPITAIDKWVILGFRDGTYIKVDATNGKKAWEINLDSFSPRKVTLAKKTLLILTAGQQLYGIDFETGSTRWLYDGGYPDGLNLNGASAPQSDGQLALIGLANGELHAVDVASGKLQWRHEAVFSDERFHDVMGDIILRGKTAVYARYDGAVISIDFSGIGKQTNWEQKVSAVTTTSQREGRLYVGCLNGDLHAFDIQTGKKIWTTPTGQAITSITAGESSLYLGGANGRINAVNVRNGEVYWHDDLDAEMNTPPVIMQGGVFFATGYKNLYGYKIF